MKQLLNLTLLLLSLSVSSVLGGDPLGGFSVIEKLPSDIIGAKKIQYGVKGPIKLSGKSILWGSKIEIQSQSLVFSFGGMINSPTGSSHKTSLFDINQNKNIPLVFSNTGISKIGQRVEELEKEVHSLENRLRNRLHLSETEEEKVEDLSLILASVKEEVNKISLKAKNLKSETKNEKRRLDIGGGYLQKVLDGLSKIKAGDAKEPKPIHVELLFEGYLDIINASCILRAEPRERAGAALLYIPQYKKVLLFGGNHADYTLSDTWLFDLEKQTWEMIFTKAKPQGRFFSTPAWLENQELVILLGGQILKTERGYHARDYQRVSKVAWAFDYRAKEWKTISNFKNPNILKNNLFITKKENIVAQIFYKTGKKKNRPYVIFSKKIMLDETPQKEVVQGGLEHGYIEIRGDQYLPTWWDNDLPTTEEIEDHKKLIENLPNNTFTRIKAPKRMSRRNRDWGTITFDFNRDQLYFYSGGHAAYTGMEVAMYSVKSHRWRINSLPEMPLYHLRGTGYFRLDRTFNLTPWMSSHTYKLYAYDSVHDQMLMSCRRKLFYFDPKNANWNQYATYNQPFKGKPWQPKFVSTLKGVVVWARSGLWMLNKEKKWVELPNSKQLPPAGDHDRSTICYDFENESVYLFRMPRKFIGEGFQYDLNKKVLRSLNIPNARTKMKDGNSGRESVCFGKEGIIAFNILDKFSEETSELYLPVYDIKENILKNWVVTLPRRPKNSPGYRYYIRYGGPNSSLAYDNNRDIGWYVSPYGSISALKCDRKTAKLQEYK